MVGYPCIQHWQVELVEGSVGELQHLKTTVVDHLNE